MCACSVAQSCPTLYDPEDCSLPGFSVHGILQVRILEWVAMPSSRGSSWPRDRTHIFCIAGRFFTAEPLEKPLVSLGQEFSSLGMPVVQGLREQFLLCKRQQGPLSPSLSLW